MRDAAGNVVPTLVDPVTVAIGNNPGGATLGGTTDQDVGSGVATFADLTLDAAGTGYTLVASAPGLTGATSTAFDVAASPTTVSLDIPGEDLVGVGLSTTLDITLGVAAGAGGLTVAVTSDNPSMVSVAAPGSVFVPAGATTGQIVLNGVSVGSTVIRANTPGYAEGTLAVTATNQIISLPTTLNVPYGLTATIPIQLATAAPAGGVTVTLTTDDASHVGVVTSTVTLSQGATLSSGTLSGVAPGPATITATAPGWVTDVTAATTTADLNVVQSSIAINAGFGGSMTVELRSGGSPIAAPSPGVTVALTALNAACVAVPAGVTIPTGFTSTTASVAYASSATTPCASYVRATAPNMTADSVNVSVASAPGIAVNPSTVGAGLQTNGNGSLGASNYGVVTVRVTSSNPGLFLVAPNSTTPGSAFIDLSLTEPTTSINYFVQGVEGQTGTGTVTVTAPGFTDGSATVTVRGVGMDLLSVPTTTTSLSPNSAFQVRIGMLDAAGTTIASEQAIRPGGVPLTATVVNSDATVAQLVTSALTGQSVTVEIGVGQNRSSTNLALGGVQFDPLSSGTTTVSATIPGVTATAGATRSATVNAPGIAVNAVTVGAGLQINSNGQLGASNYGAVTVRVTSSNPGLFLVAPNSTTPGSAFIDLSLTEPTTSINYFVQGVEGQTGTGTVTVTAPGFTDGSATVTVRGVGMDLLSVPTTTTSLSPNSAFQVRIGMLDAAGTTIASEQAIRPGGVPLTATVVNSDATVAQLVTSALTGQSVTVEIGVGQNRSSTNLALGGVQFDPLSSGTTTVSATIPGVTATAGATRTVIVN